MTVKIIVAILQCLYYAVVVNRDYYQNPIDNQTCEEHHLVVFSVVVPFSFPGDVDDEPGDQFDGDEIQAREFSIPGKGEIDIDSQGC